MPAKTEKQRKAAGAELARRRKGGKPAKGRPFGMTPVRVLEEFARRRKT